MISWSNGRILSSTDRDIGSIPIEITLKIINKHKDVYCKFTFIHSGQMVKTEELKSFNLGSNPNGEEKYVLIWGYNSTGEIMLCKFGQCKKFFPNLFI